MEAPQETQRLLTAMDAFLAPQEGQMTEDVLVKPAIGDEGRQGARREQANRNPTTAAGVAPTTTGYILRAHRGP
jgi:hypothetical protein